MFLNVSNHPSALWDDNQRNTAHTYGEVRDYPFPNIPPTATLHEVSVIAQEHARSITVLRPDAVLCQGEFTFCFMLVMLLQSQGFLVLAACSERCSTESILSDGTRKKTLLFRFVQFREYGRLPGYDMGVD